MSKWIAAVVMVVLVLAWPLTLLAAQTCVILNEETLGEHADPVQLAAFWLPKLEHLHAAIPSLSPREEAWLKDELSAPLTSDRFRRAISSPEFALRKAKENAGSLLGYKIRRSLRYFRNGINHILRNRRRTFERVD